MIRCDKAFLLLLVLTFLFPGCQQQSTLDLEQKELPADAQNKSAEEITAKGTEADLPVPFEYSFQPHVISKEYIKAYGPEIEPMFYEFCDAVLAGRDEFPCPSTEIIHRLISIARTCLPVAAHCINEDRIYVENGIGHISYEMDHKELAQVVRSFKERVNSVITSAVPYRDEDFIIAAELLTAVAHKDSVDQSGFDLDNSLHIEPYRAIMENKGICQEIAGEYIYYLLQVGINATTCSALSRNQESAHMWALVELDHQYYHVDPMFTVDYKDSLAFFCLTDEMREQYGDYPIENFSYAESDLLRHEDYAAYSERFKPLWRAESYTINRADKKMELSLFDVCLPAENDAFYY